MQRYKEHKKHPVFSHDELILTTALNDTSIATAHWLQDEMKNLLDRELTLREQLLKKCKGIKVTLDEIDRPEEEVQCRHCNAYVYLSQVGCRCTTKVVCHDHVSEVREKEIGYLCCFIWTALTVFVQTCRLHCINIVFTPYDSFVNVIPQSISSD